MSRFQPEIIHQQLGAAFYDKVGGSFFSGRNFALS